MAVGVVNGIVYVIGGERTSSGGTFAQNEAYNPTTNTWTTAAPMLTPRHGAAFGVINGTRMDSRQIQLGLKYVF